MPDYNTNYTRALNTLPYPPPVNSDLVDLNMDSQDYFQEALADSHLQGSLRKPDQHLANLLYSLIIPILSFHYYPINILFYPEKLYSLSQLYLFCGYIILLPNTNPQTYPFLPILKSSKSCLYQCFPYNPNNQVLRRFNSL